MHSKVEAMRSGNLLAYQQGYLTLIDWNKTILGFYPAPTDLSTRVWLCRYSF